VCEAIRVGSGLAHAEALRGTVSRRGAEALGKRTAVPVAAVVVNPIGVATSPSPFERLHLVDTAIVDKDLLDAT